MTTYICKCGRRVKKSTDASTTGNRLSGYAPGHECWGCPYAMPYGGFQWDESARTVCRETRGYECRISKPLTYASEFAGSIKDKCTCRVYSLDFDFLSQVSVWIKDTYPDREIFGSFSKDIRASDYGADGRYCLTITCTQNLKGVAAKRELFGRFFTPNGSRKDMTPQQEMEKILADIKKAKEGFSCAPAQNAAVVATTNDPAAESVAEIPTTSESEADASESTPEKSPQNCESAPAASAVGSSVPPFSMTKNFDFTVLGDLSEQAAEADQQFDLHYGAAQDEYLISCIYLARIHTLTAKSGRYGGGTWTKWYESKGLGEGSVRRMIQNGEAFNSANLAELKQLPELTRKDLNLIARSGCAQQLVEAAGDSQRVQDLLAQIKAKDDAYQNVLKENQQLRTDRVEAMSRADRAEAREEEARQAAHTYHVQLEEATASRNSLLDQQSAYISDINGLKERVDAAEAREEEAWKMQSKAETRAQDAEKQLEGSRQVAEAAKRRADKWQAEAESLKKQPITAVVDEEEVDKRAGEKAYKMASDMTAELKAQLDQATADNEQDARNAYDGLLLAGRTITNAWQMAKPLFAKLPEDQRDTAANQLVRTLSNIQGEVSRCL